MSRPLKLTLPYKLPTFDSASPTLTNGLVTGLVSTSTSFVSSAGGTVSVNSLSGDLAIVSINFSNSPYTVSLNDNQGTLLLVDCTAGVVVVDLMPATATGRVLFVKKVDSSANGITITPNGSDTIEGNATFSVGPNQWMTVGLVDGAAGVWHVHSIRPT